MPKQLTGAVVVITGASSGIGRATAHAFAEQGASLVLAARSEAALHECAIECRERGGRALVVPTDVGYEEQVMRLAGQAVEEFGRIDVWVNNAGVFMLSLFEETPAAEFERVIRTNLMGTVHGARAALPVFREQGEGVLINVASLVGMIGQPYASAYVASKWAVRGLSESLRMELTEQPNIHVCTILPPSIDTPLFQHAANYTGRAIKPMDPVHAPEEVAQAIVGAARSPRREIVIGTFSHVLGWGQNLSPRTLERVMARQVEVDHFQDLPATSSSGNVFAPMPAINAVHGGWRRSTPRRQTRSRATTGAAVAGAAALVALPLGYYAWQQWQRRESSPRRRFS